MDHLIDDNDRLETCPFCGAEAEIISIAGETDDINTGRPTCVQCTSSAAVSVKKDRPPCNPMATQCPRCQNVLAECDFCETGDS